MSGCRFGLFGGNWGGGGGQNGGLGEIEKERRDSERKQELYFNALIVVWTRYAKDVT